MNVARAESISRSLRRLLYKATPMLGLEEKYQRQLFYAQTHNLGAAAYQLGNTSSRTITEVCLLYTSPSPRDRQKSRMPSSA